MTAGSIGMEQRKFVCYAMWLFIVYLASWIRGINFTVDLQGLVFTTNLIFFSQEGFSEPSMDLDLDVYDQLQLEQRNARVLFHLWEMCLFFADMTLSSVNSLYKESQSALLLRKA